MLQGILIKKIIDIVLKRIMEKSAIRKMRKYVEEDNELDLEVRKLKKKIKMLEKVAHPIRDFVTCDCCKKKLKQKIRR